MGLEDIVGRLYAESIMPREKSEDTALPNVHFSLLQRAMRHYYEAAKYYVSDLAKAAEERASRANDYLTQKVHSYAAHLQDFSHLFPMPEFSWIEGDFHGLLGYTVPTLANTGKIAIHSIAKASYALLLHIAAHEVFHRVHPYDWDHSQVYRMADYAYPPA